MDPNQRRLGVCESCALAKAKQKNVPYDMKSHDKKDKSKQTAYLDQCLVKDTITGKRANWVWWIMVLGYAGLKITKFFRAKNKMIEPTAELLHQLHEEGNGSAKLRMDNAGENIKLKQRMESSAWKLPIKVEFTARNTPQQNSPAETSFTTITGRAKAMFNAARIPQSMRHILFPYAAQTATKLDGLSVVTINGITATRYKHQMGFEPKWTKYLHTWGEARTVSLKGKNTQKSKIKV